MPASAPIALGKKEKVVILRAVNPASVVCPESILVNALTTLGVPLHPDPRFAYVETREAMPDGTVQRVLTWTLLATAADGQETGKLIKKWRDGKWLAANPASELAVLKVGLENMLRLAERIRATPHVIVLRKGKKLAMIPSQLPAPEQEAIRKKFEQES